MNDKVSFAFVDGCLVVKVDLNKDGQPFLELKIDLAEIPEEIFSMISAKKAAVAA